ncbi:MAG TPA: ADP-ribosyltransferase [Methanoregulaceae archaeon]|nr:MAG: hypothetical protein IPI71_02005 [Methanolinea sp.]HON82311.1 ADP-ribosyltransferase [Methanoregulaceae archaeon]HPD11077.1 ADP-ribosyltransferase [Methanoregulaceae archaeon]HRT16147.1 ADP-ribosyltransferase [Methanoregulaceae archaeon]HRU31687.1 ADP-ribosyltransferase [Methanoregulaceae archaeon]
MLPWNQRRDLSLLEKEAIELYIQSGEVINAYLRDPITLPRPYRPFFQKFMTQLDSALEKSPLNKQVILYRGITGQYADEFLEDVGKGKNEFSDEGYVSFSSNEDIAEEYAIECQNRGIIFVHEGKRNDNVLFIGGQEQEFLYPRKTSWRIISCKTITTGSCIITFIYIERK